MTHTNIPQTEAQAVSREVGFVSPPIKNLWVPKVAQASFFNSRDPLAPFVCTWTCAFCLHTHTLAHMHTHTCHQAQPSRSTAPEKPSSLWSSPGVVPHTCTPERAAHLHAPLPGVQPQAGQSLITCICLPVSQNHE